MKHLRSPIVSSIVLHSGQWLNKPRAKAEKGREKPGGRRGGVVAKWKGSREDVVRERTVCVENDKEKSQVLCRAEN